MLFLTQLFGGTGSDRHHSARSNVLLPGLRALRSLGNA